MATEDAVLGDWSLWERVMHFTVHFDKRVVSARVSREVLEALEALEGKSFETREDFKRAFLLHLDAVLAATIRKASKSTNVDPEPIQLLEADF